MKKKTWLWLVLGGLALLQVPLHAQWDASKPVANSALVSSEFRNNWAAIAQTVGASNAAQNGDLATWSGGGSAAPDNFTLSGAGAAIARTGSGEADTFSFGTGQYAAKITRSGADAKLTQTVISSGDFSKYTNLQGFKFSVAMKGKTSTASHLRIVVDDGVATTASSYHTGGGAEEHLTATHTLNGSATKLEVRAEVNTTDAAAYCGGFIFLYGAIPPSDWAPSTVLPDASASQRGAVSTGTQTFAGLKTFAEHLLFEPGSSSTSATVSGRLSTNTTSVGNVGTGEDDLMTYPLQGGSLASNGQAVRISAYFDGAANANSKTLKFYFGSTAVTVVNGSTTSDGNVWLEAEIIRVGATSQVVIIGATSLQSIFNAGRSFEAFATPAETLSSNVTIKFTATATSDNDYAQKAMVVRVD